MFDRLDINFKYQVLMQEMSAVGIPPSSLQGCIYSVFRNKRLILKAFYVELTLSWVRCKNRTGRSIRHIYEFADSDVEISSRSSALWQIASPRYFSLTKEQKTSEGAKKLIEATIVSCDSEHPMLAFAVEERASGLFLGFCGLNSHDEETKKV